jgi:hypothetical protein
MQERIIEKFEALLQEGQQILSNCGWDGRSYRAHPNDIEYRRFRAEATNLVKRACGEDSDHYQELKRLAEGERTSGNSYYFKDCFGVLQAAHRDFEGGYLFDLRSLVAADLLGDFIDQAETLVKEGYHVPAASLAGAVLEDTLRKLCHKNNILVPERTKIDKLNADLARAVVYSKLVQKRITALADIRNNADHGHFDKFSSDDVEDMVKWLRRFTADYLE